LAVLSFSDNLGAMRLAALALAAALISPAHAQTAPVEGAVVEAFELIGDRTVFFEPAADGKIRILRVIDNSRSMPIPKTPGQVGVGMTFAREIGTVIEFNSGLDYGFTYKAGVVTKGDGVDIVNPLEVCPIGKGLVGAEQWPIPYPRILISNVARNDAPRPAGC
jgi:hypothetical protein